MNIKLIVSVDQMIWRAYVPGFYVEVNLEKKNWLLCCSCKVNKNAIKSNLEILHKGLALHSSKTKISLF